MKREDLIKRDDFWIESIREMQILHWQDSDLTIKEILKLKNELINSLSGTTVKFCEGRSAEILHKHYYHMCNYRFCPDCGMNVRPE